MGNLSKLEQIINGKIMNLHTAYLAKVISFNSTTANIQPLLAVKQYGKESEPAAIIPDVPVIISARKKGENEPLSTGDIVLVVCCERSITAAKKGEISTSTAGGQYSLSDSVIIGIL